MLDLKTTGQILGFTNKWKGDDLMLNIKLEIVLVGEAAKEALAQLGIQHLELWGPNGLPWNDGIDAYKLGRPIHDLEVTMVYAPHISPITVELVGAHFDKIELLAEQNETLVIGGTLKDQKVVHSELADLAWLSQYDTLGVTMSEAQKGLDLN